MFEYMFSATIPGMALSGGQKSPPLTSVVKEKILGLPVVSQ